MAASRKQYGSIESLLGELVDFRNAGAWKSFLQRYGPVMMAVANQHALDPHDAQDCFLHICEKLCEDDGRRLRSFDPALGGRFRTWLTAIASNLCTDWCRARYGRLGIPRAIAALPARERRVFELNVVEGLDRELCLIGIRQCFPETTRSDLSEALVVAPPDVGAKHIQSHHLGLVGQLETERRRVLLANLLRVHGAVFGGALPHVRSVVPGQGPPATGGPRSP